MKLLINTPIEELSILKENQTKVIKKDFNIHNLYDLANFFPFRYVNRTKFHKIDQLRTDDINKEVQIIGKITSKEEIRTKNKSRLVATLREADNSIDLIWFKGIKWIKSFLEMGKEYVVFGRLNQFNFSFNIPHPEIELLSNFKKKKITITPIYPSSDGLKRNKVNNKIISNLIRTFFSRYYDYISETLSNNLINEHNLLSKKESLLNIHFPKNKDLLDKAIFRLKFEELFYIQLSLISKKIIRKSKYKGHKFEKIGDYFKNFYKNHIPFELTKAQKRVIKEIRNDTIKNIQMNRLIQGDVGSGKTIVSLMAMLIAIDNGFQACIMAPTEILASQHFYNITKLVEKLNIKTALITGNTKNKDRNVIIEQLQNNKIQILIGTHAIIEDSVKFNNLGIAIIDEQQRFGVVQRSKLWKKNTIPPHIIVTTATPIPRTMAMNLYGDLDISIIDEMPKGRKPIKTIHQYENNRLKVFNFLKNKILKGRQVYIVYPLIEESQKLDYQNLMDGYENIVSYFPLPQFQVSILHGRMNPEDKDYEMNRFITKQTQIIVSTTVIEVGIDVPNASIMLIEDAERFGLSQLHQLRGRVGRGDEQSFCILMTKYKLTSNAKERIKTIVNSNDGFEISKVDLKLRGAGDIAGTQQSGIIKLKIADLTKDEKILVLARKSAIKLLNEDPNMINNKVVKSSYQIIKKNKIYWNVS